MKRSEEVFSRSAGGSLRMQAAAVAASSGLLLGLGCASPGHPSPPSLQVPRLATNISATRQGDEVHLRWTTPSRTTDQIDLKPPITAEICRSSVSTAAPRPLPVRAGECAPVLRVPVQPGASEASDALPAALATGAAGLLAYRVQLRGPLGKTAGPSPIVYAASGAAPSPVTDLRVSDTKEGALLQWTAEPTPFLAVELTRELVSAATPAKPRTQRSTKPFRPRSEASPSGDSKTVRLSAGSTDSGGAVDRSAAVGATYRYTAERVLTVTLGSHTLELRSSQSVPVPLVLRDVFPPDAPGGLVATPGPGSIDLSWEPGKETDIAGYRVYRTEVSADNAAAGAEPSSSGPGQWQRLTTDLLAIPAYRDLSAVSGHAYRYRVTAVGSNGNESASSTEAAETAP